MNKEKENQAIILKMVEIDRNSFAVEVKDGNVSVNLTKMAKPFGKAKQPSDWLKTQESKDYLRALSAPVKTGTADLVKVRQGGTPEEQGTWALDYRIAMRFAQWVSPEFSIKVDGLLVNLMLGKDCAFVEPDNGSLIVYEFRTRVRVIRIDDAIHYKAGDVSRLCGIKNSVFNLMKHLPSLKNFTKITGEYSNVPEWWCNREGLRELLLTRKNRNMLRLHDAIFGNGQLSLLGSENGQRVLPEGGAL
jgi:hypothetical protein